MRILDYSTPARKAVNLASSGVSDTVDHTPTIKPPLVSNHSGGPVTIACVPVDSPDVVTLTIPDGVLFTFPFVTSRIKSTGSTGLIAALDAGLVDIVLLKE